MDGFLGLAPRQPAFFERVRREQENRWNQLESDEVLAAPWHQLFRQLRSDPRHVLSELLQNADDAGATWACAAIQGTDFVFEHDGRDFSESDFQSLCRFGLSNKRHLHTIGFRGIGFKTTFSLGPRVRLSTPSLAVYFDESRFTEPVWDGDNGRREHVTIRVEVDSAEKLAAVQTYFDEWCESAIPLLFFRHLRLLDLNGVRVQKSLLGTGPVPNSQWASLSGLDEVVLLIESELMDFPEEAVREVRSERGDAGLNLPPCRVQLVAGQKSLSRAYSVLPTTVQLSLPFSVNAPFVQDPARTGLKSPVASPTNGWLLSRLGALAAHATIAWLGNPELTIAERARAYEELVPESPSVQSRTTGDECTSRVLDAFGEVVRGEKVLLTTEGHVLGKAECLALPSELLDVWSPEECLSLFAFGQQAILAADASVDARKRLSAWSLLGECSPDHIVKCLVAGPRPPRPQSEHSLVHLWSFVQRYIRAYGRYWYSPGSIRLVPAEARAHLEPADKVTMVQGSELSADDRTFLAGYAFLADPAWLDYLREQREGIGSSERDVELDEAQELLASLSRSMSSGLARAIEQASEVVFSGREPGEAGFRLAYLAARAGTRVPDSFRFLCEDGHWRSVTQGLLALRSVALDCLSTEWVDSRLVHERYGQAEAQRDREAWKRWAGSSNSRLLGFPRPDPLTSRVYGRERVQSFISSRGGRVLAGWDFPLRTPDFIIHDYDYSEELWASFANEAEKDPSVWSEVVLGIAAAWGNEWDKRSQALVTNEGYSKSHPIEHGVLAAAWLQKLRDLPCLPDDRGNLRVPAELMRATAQTAPLHGIEPFLRSDFDQTAYHPFLDLLGVRSSPDSVDTLLSRLRALAGARGVPIQSLVTLYGTLDRVYDYLPRYASEQLRESFGQEKLTYSQAGTWHTSTDIFRRNPEDLPGVSIISPDVADLGLWGKLGVPLEPTDDYLLQWLQALPSGERLKEPEFRRARGVLVRLGARVWTEAGHWLALDRTWAAVEGLRWRVGRTKQLPALYPHLRRQVLDASMFDSDGELAQPWAVLPVLSQAIEWRLDGCDSEGPASRPVWLLPLALGLLRIRPTQTREEAGNGEASESWRKEALALARSEVQHVASLRVRPYLEGLPAGDSSETTAIWRDGLIYVRGADPKVHRDLVDELSRQFDVLEIRRAITDCVGRDPQWIVAYLESNLDLMPEPLIPGVDSRENGMPAAGADGEPSSLVPPDGHGTVLVTEAVVDQYGDVDEEGEPDAAVPGSDLVAAVDRRGGRQRQSQDNAFRLHLLSRGYRPDTSTGVFADRAGNVVLKEEGLFPWREYDVQGTLVRMYRIQRGSLAEGIEQPTAVWDLMREYSETAVLVLHRDGHTREQVTWSELEASLRQRSADFNPASYRYWLL